MKKVFIMAFITLFFCSFVSVEASLGNIKTRMTSFDMIGGEIKMDRNQTGSFAERPDSAPISLTKSGVSRMNLERGNLSKVQSFIDVGTALNARMNPTFNILGCPGVAAYINTTPSYSYNPGAAIAVADDIELAVEGGGNLCCYEIAFLFDEYVSPTIVTSVLYDAAPNAGGRQIPGTEMSWEFTSGDEIGGYILTANLVNSVTIPEKVYLSISKTCANNRFVLTGEAILGYTDDIFCLKDPDWNCNYSFSGVPWAGFYAALYLEGEEPDLCSGVLSYSNPNNVAWFEPGAGVYIADDIVQGFQGEGELCCYEIKFYFRQYFDPGVTVSASLYNGPPNAGGQEILGTAFSWVFDSTDPTGLVYRLYGELPTPVPIPQGVYLVMQTSHDENGFIISGQSAFGFTANKFCKKAPDWNCNYWFGGEPWAGFYAKLYLDSIPPTPTPTNTPTQTPTNTSSHTPTSTPTPTNTPTRTPTNTPIPTVTPIPTYTPPPSATQCINNGDVNQDSLLTAADAQLAFLITLGQYSPSHVEECSADCNGDSLVTAADAQLIFLTVLGTANCVDPL